MNAFDEFVIPDVAPPAESFVVANASAFHDDVAPEQIDVAPAVKVLKDRPIRVHKTIIIKRLPPVKSVLSDLSDVYIKLKSGLFCKNGVFYYQWNTPSGEFGGFLETISVD